MKLLLVSVVLLNMLIFVVSNELEKVESQEHGKFGTGTILNSKTKNFCESDLNSESVTLPDQFDWRKHGRVSPVQNQTSSCSSCWAFAVAGILEGQMDNLINLSEQNLVDCLGHGCDSGFTITEALQYVQDHGIMRDDDYRYKGVNGSCKHDENKNVLKVADHCYKRGLSEQDLKTILVQQGPVAIGINEKNGKPQEFVEFYNGTIYRCISSTDDSSLIHTMLLVGYATDPDEGPYWIIKNSWGEKWGDKGYLKMAIDNSSFCGIYVDVNMATIKLEK